MANNLMKFFTQTFIESFLHLFVHLRNFPSMAEKFAILGASSAKMPSSPFEAQHLIDTLFACDNSELTSRGRRIISIIPVDELDKKF